MSMDDNDVQMIFGDLGGLKLSDICLTGEENPEKPHPGNLSRDRTRTRCVTSAHATTCSTAVDKLNLREVDCDPGDCIDLVKDRHQLLDNVRAVMNLRVP